MMMMMMMIMMIIQVYISYGLITAAGVAMAQNSFMLMLGQVMMVMLKVTICGHNHDRGLRIGRVSMVSSRLQKASQAGGKSCS